MLHIIRQSQTQLKNDGYYSGNIDGVDGPVTRQAIRKYQQSQNLTPWRFSLCGTSW